MWNIQGSIHKIIPDLYQGFSRLFLSIIKFVAVVTMKVSQKGKREFRQYKSTQIWKVKYDIFLH
jgi:hypothetical protein